MLDVPSITGIIATVGVLVGVVFTILELRNLVKTRQTDLVIRLFSKMNTKEYLEAWGKVRDREVVDYNDYKKRYGFVELNQVSLLLEQVGVLLHRRLIDIDLVDDLFRGPAIVAWEKIRPIIEVTRKKYNQPRFDWAIEYLYNETKKREQRLQQTQQ